MIRLGDNRGRVMTHPRDQGPLRQAHRARTAAAASHLPVRRAVRPVSWPLQTQLRQPLNGGHRVNPERAAAERSSESNWSPVRQIEGF
jgi:hypothetical protein